MRIELQDTDFEQGIAEVGVSDADSWVELRVSFHSVIRYVDDSFSHAFGTHADGHWEIKMDDFAFKIVDGEGEVAIDEEAMIDALYAATDEFDWRAYECKLRDDALCA